jgi:hypothetical protein
MAKAITNAFIAALKIKDNPKKYTNPFKKPLNKLDGVYSKSVVLAILY